jgi:hypothetical protein
MFKKLGITGLVLASVMAVAGPQVASARDRDDVRYSRDTRADNQRHERAEWRDRDRDRDDRRFRDRDDYARGYYGNGYRANGYYTNGYYANGYYDASGWWHPYR